MKTQVSETALGYRTWFHVWLCLLCSGNFLQTLSAQVATNDRPNIVFLLTDDQATISMGCYGNRDVRTPNLDALAERGLVFDSHYVTTSICMASRASIMTGLYEYRTGCNFTRGDMKAEHWANSYPVLLRKAGYRTAFAGKLGFQVEGQARLPSDQFDNWGGGPGQTSYQTARNQSMTRFADQYPHSTRSYGAFGSEFIRESVAARQPFCLSISFKAPHRPVNPDPAFDKIYEKTVFQKPENFGRQFGEHLADQSKTGRQYPRFEEWGYATDYDNAMRKYHQLVYAVDQAVGMIVQEISNQGVRDNTVIVFTSDNGYFCGSHGYGSKVLPYEESSRVPLIVFDPRFRASHGRRTRSLTGSIDLAPTLLDMAGVEVPVGIDGKSLVPLLDNPTGTVRDRLSLMNFWGPESTHSFAVVTRDWKYVYWYSETMGMKATEELFDMRGKRLEMANLVSQDSCSDELNQVRQVYDQAVYRIGELATDEEYRIYKDLFDRKQTWAAKQSRLSK